MCTSPPEELSDEKILELIGSVKGNTKVILTVLMNQFSKFKELLGSRDEEVRTLKQDVLNLRKDVTRLEDLLDNESAYERRDTVIISGKNIPHGTPTEKSSVVVQKLCQEKFNIQISDADISTAHRLGKNSQNPDKRPIIVKLCRRDIKREIIVKSRQAQHNVQARERIYVNESLTPKRKAILHALRNMKSMDNSAVTGCTSIDGSVYAFTKNPANDSRDRKHMVTTHQQLVDFCAEFVQQPLERFLAEWKF